MPTILKSRKVQMALIAVVGEIIVALSPELEGSRATLMTAIGALFVALIGAHTLTDIAAISKLSQPEQSKRDATH